MPLTDPELDLLREVLTEDPSDEVFVQVGEELVRRALWPEAVQILKQGLASHPDELDAWVFLARAALEIGEFGLTLEAWAAAGAAHQASAELARVRILALERSGQLDAARQAVEQYELDHPENDVVIEAVKERIEAPPPAFGRAAADPFLTVRQAERYVALGRHDRAIRVYRRILFRHPDDAGIHARLFQLAARPHDLAEDLSEELEDPNLVPPDLQMPAPALGVAADARVTAVGAPDRSADSGPTLAPEDAPAGLADFIASARAAERRPPDEPDDDSGDTGDDVTEPLPGLATLGLPTAKRRRKRSLLRR